MEVHPLLMLENQNCEDAACCRPPARAKDRECAGRLSGPKSSKLSVAMALQAPETTSPRGMRRLPAAPSVSVASAPVTLLLALTPSDLTITAIANVPCQVGTASRLEGTASGRRIPSQRSLQM